jgi:hypothetical protein
MIVVDPQALPFPQLLSDDGVKRVDESLSSSFRFQHEDGLSKPSFSEALSLSIEFDAFR